MNLPSTHQVRIVDGKALRSLLRTLRDLHGSERKAAKWLGLVQSTFHRLHTGKVSEFLTFETYSRIKTVLEEHDPGPFGTIEEPNPPYIGLLDRFEVCVLSGDGEFVMQNYQAWIKKEIQRLSQHGSSMVVELWDHPRSRWYLKAFLKRIGWGEELPPPEELRIWLALYRVVEPLTAGEITWGVELTWREMEERREFWKYLIAALTRERILLKRESDLDRVRHPVEDSLEEFKAWLAEDNTAGLPREDWTLEAGGDPLVMSPSEDLLEDQEEPDEEKGGEES